jgi:hypothetical protein
VGVTLLTYGFLPTSNQWKLTGKDGGYWIQPKQRFIASSTVSSAANPTITK